MELLAFGHAGVPMVVFPTSMGAFFDYEDRGMVSAVADKIESGAMRLFCVATLDTETFYARSAPPRARIDRYLAYERYVVDLYLYECRIQSGALEPLAVNAFKWVTSAEFDQYPFTPADEASMNKLLDVG